MSIALAHAEELLLDLGALNRSASAAAELGRRAKLDRAASHARYDHDIGRKMLAFPVHPRYARMLLAAQEYGCVYQACLVAALTQGRDLLLAAGGKEVKPSSARICSARRRRRISGF